MLWVKSLLKYFNLKIASSQYFSVNSTTAWTQIYGQNAFAIKERILTKQWNDTIKID